MSIEAWIGVIATIIGLVCSGLAFLYKVFRYGITEEIYTVIDKGNSETYEAHQKIRTDMTNLIDKRILEADNARKENFALQRKNDSDQIKNIDKQVSEMRLITEKQLASISTDIKIMSNNMVSLGNTLISHQGKIETLEKVVDRLDNK